jgi:hypothetical protein
VPVIKILAPINQTYTNKVPLEFIVNTNYSDAGYLMWDWKKMDTHYNSSLEGNSTLENLPDGNYIIRVSAISDKGDHISASAFFSYQNFLYARPSPFHPSIL